MGGYVLVLTTKLVAGGQLQWGERNSASGSTKRRVRLAKQLLECLSGGDVDSMPRDVIGISSLWKCVAPPV